MAQTRKLPALPFILATAFAIAGALASAAVAEPRIFTLPDRNEASLPGASNGAEHGILIRRGSGFPEPELAVPEASAPDQVVVEPVETRRVVVRRNRYRY